MRIGLGLIAGCGVLVLAVGTSWSAPPTQDKPMTAPATTMSAQQIGPGMSGGPRATGVLNKIEALTANECTQLGGSVSTSYPGICASGKLCVREDNYHKVHAVCLTKE